MSSDNVNISNYNSILCSLDFSNPRFFKPLDKLVLKVIFLPRDNLSYPNYDRFELKTTDCSTVLFFLNYLIKFKATGIDKISARLFRECADLVASSSLLVPFSKDLLYRVFFGLNGNPQMQLKVIPLFKQRERSDLNNYRPFSVIPVVAKVFKRIVYNQF